MSKILIGNTFPTSLIRRKVKVFPLSIEDAKLLLEEGFASYWGHTNTIPAANRLLGIDVTPKTERPAIGLSPNNFPTLNGETFKTVLVLSPSYVGQYRPQVGEEVRENKITGWQCLLWEFEYV